MARLAMRAALVATVVGAMIFSVTYGITGHVNISSISCVGAASLVNYFAKRCPVMLGGIAETVRRGIMQLVMNYTIVGFAILYALVVHYVLYVEPVNARAAAVSLPMLEGPATANYYSSTGWYMGQAQGPPSPSSPPMLYKYGSKAKILIFPYKVWTNFSPNAHSSHSVPQNTMRKAQNDRSKCDPKSVGGRRSTI